MSHDLDGKYGRPRSPERVDKWEKDSAPESLSEFDGALAGELVTLEQVVQCSLLRASARAKNYIWAMDVDGRIKIAVEELAMEQPKTGSGGYPRRRGFTHPAEEKKLGHPTLLGAGEARIAGELAFDDFDGRLRWVFNANSGRYCRQAPPTSDQVEGAAEIFRRHGLDIVIDDL